MKHDTACFILCNLYCRFQHRMYINYMHETKLIFEWLCREEDYDVAVEHAWPNKPGADICTSCSALYGTTIGGRLRRGCPKCCNSRDAFCHPYEVQQLAIVMHISQPLCEYLLSFALLSIQAFKEKLANAASSLASTEPQQHSSVEEMPQKVSTH